MRRKPRMEENDRLKGFGRRPTLKKTPKENAIFKPAELCDFQNGDDKVMHISLQEVPDHAR
jgi:hypothetical protein